MKYLVEANEIIETLGDCSSAIIAININDSVIKPCRTEVNVCVKKSSGQNGCSQHCWSQACNPRQDPYSL